jgi:glycosyltransferase involved in cell wall biosynthesis
MPKITAYIIAYNEEAKVKAAVESVLWADEIIVADSYSTDNTAKIAEQLGAKVVQVPFKGFGDLRNQALKACTQEWVFSLDSDERCTPEARDEILKIIEDSNSLDIYYMPRRNYFMGRWIKHSGWYPNYRQPQLFRNGKMTYTLEEVHEGYVKHSEKPIGNLTQAIWQIPFKDLGEVMHKSNRYSTLGVEKLITKKKTATMGKAFTHGLWSFIKHYVFKRGFLDGWPGFIIALGNFEGTFYRYAKLYEKQQHWDVPTAEPLRKR